MRSAGEKQMKGSGCRDIAEFTGVAAIGRTLIFVGLQVHQIID